MAGYRLTEFAVGDLTSILAASFNLHGEEARARYEALLKAAMRCAAKDPKIIVSKDCARLQAGLRSLHLRHARSSSDTGHVRSPVHIIYYREERDGLIEIVRVLHERMEPSRRLGASQE